jgi:hypothetical protein
VRAILPVHLILSDFSYRYILYMIVAQYLYIYMPALLHWNFCLENGFAYRLYASLLELYSIQSVCGKDNND